MRSFKYLSLMALATLAAADAGTGAAADAEAPKSSKSIVPAKYGTKYRGGGSGELADFINKQCSSDKGFVFADFFTLARKNGVDEAKVAHYEGMVNRKEHGAQGRARMTIRNMLAPIARKQGHLVGLNDKKVKLDIPAAPNAKKQETAAAE